MVQHMSNVDNDDVCMICRTGHFTKRLERLEFLQWTDKGPLRCEVTVLVGICTHCHYRTWGSDAEALMREAVRQEYEKLA